MKTIKILVLTVVIILLIPLLGYASWMLRKSTHLDIVVVNKSMVQYQGSENEAMNYVLTGKKIFTSGSRPYNLRIDHQGFNYIDGEFRSKFPRLKDIDRTVEKTDLAYYADVAGVMSSQFKKLKNGQEDKLEYGGLNFGDHTLLRKLIENNKPLVIEQCFFASPTDPLVRFNIEQLLDTYMVGWIGRIVNRLEASTTSERIDWKEYYKEIHGEDYTGSGKGMVFMNFEIGHIVVLEETTHYDPEQRFVISTEEGVEKYGLPEEVDFTGWFSVLHEGRNDVLSSFQIAPTEEGERVLNEEGIPKSFPALIRFRDNSFVMAGDFGRTNVESFFPRVEGLRQIFGLIKGSSKNSSSFFYSFFQPFMSTLVQDAKDNAREEEAGQAE